MDELERFGRFSLDVQRGARAQPQATFLDWALQRLARDLPFDGAVWGSGHAVGLVVTIHSVHVHRLPPQFMLDYAEVQRHDNLQHESVRHLGDTIPADAASAPPVLQPFLQRYRLEHGLSTVDADPRTSLMNCIAVYRHDRERPFSEAERGFMQAAYPQLTEASTQNRLAHLVNSSGPRFAGPWRPAAADRTGLLHHADAEFARLVLHEWPDWTGPYLPAPLFPALTAGGVQRVGGERVVFKISPMGDLSLVQVREAAPVDQLTTREREVAAYSAQGYSHKEIARLLELAPTTVRNHLATACRRLQVKNKAQLSALVQQLE